MVQLQTAGPQETQDFGAKLAALLQPGDVLLLYGELGAGKTELVRGIAQGLGVTPDQVSSPTFALIHEYAGRLPLIHVDLYRLAQVDEDLLETLEEYWQQPVITVIEWAERLQDSLPVEYLAITLTWLDAQSRSLCLAGAGPRGKHLAQACQALVPDPALPQGS